MEKDIVAELWAITSIHQLKARYCRLVDTKQWNELVKLFTADARLDGFGSVPDGTDPANFVAGIAKRLDQAITVHHVQAPEIRLTGPGAARGIWSMVDYVDFHATEALPSGDDRRGWIGWGYYEEEYVRVGDHWLFSHMRLTRQRMDELGADHPRATFGRHGPGTDWL